MRIVCTYNSFWAVSNYETHFKNHIKIIEKGKNAVAQENQSNRPNSSENTSENNSELSKILGRKAN